MTRAIPVDVYDKDGNMTKIEVNTPSGEHIFDFLWDPTDEQTNENRVKFREWAYRILKQKDYEVAK
jgi:hypothetical protein